MCFFIMRMVMVVPVIMLMIVTVMIMVFMRMLMPMIIMLMVRLSRNDHQRQLITQKPGTPYHYDGRMSWGRCR